MRIVVLLGFLTFLVGAAVVSWKTAPKECKEDSTSCIIYPRDWNPQFYKGPSTKEPLPMGKYPRGFFDINLYRGDPTDLRSAQWVRLYFIEGDIAWIERKKLLRFSDLRPVKRCWPIKHMHIEAGDAPGGLIVFKRDGTGVVSYQRKKPDEVKAWYADDVFSIRYLKPKNEDIDGRQAAWSYVYSMAIVHKSNWISEGTIEDFFEDTKSCSKGPEVE